MTVAAFSVSAGAAVRINCTDPSTNTTLSAKSLPKTDSLGNTIEAKIKLNGTQVKLERLHQLDLKSGIAYRGAIADAGYADHVALALGAPAVAGQSNFTDAVLNIHDDVIDPSTHKKVERHLEYKFSCAVLPAPTFVDPCAGRTLAELNSALRQASIDKSNDGVDQSLSCGADVNTVDAHGCTPLMLVAETGVFDCGTKSAAKDSLLFTRAKSIFSTLLTLGAYTVETDQRGDSVLHKVIRNDETAMLSELIGVVEDFNIQNNDGDTPLIYAARDGAAISVRMLVTGGASVELKNKSGLSAYDVGAKLDKDTRSLLLAPTETATLAANDDGTCTPQRFELPKQKAVKLKFVSGKSKMFTLSIPEAGVSMMVDAGKTQEKTITFDNAGVFPFTCGPMGASQMTGKITVK